MTAKSLFNIVLKVLGIYFIKDIIIAIPSLFGVLYELGNSDVSSAFIESKQRRTSANTSR